jgi:queuosine precursor transporter
MLYSTEAFSFLQLLVSWGFLIYMFLRYGKGGVFVFLVLAVVLSNIQVLKLGIFFWSPEPVALGTILFTSTFLAGNILTEFCSLQVARQGITIGFLGMAFFSIQMLLQIWIPPLQDPELNSGHDAMYLLFMPMPWLYLASTIAYFISQRTDIRIYNMIKVETGEKMLWLRTCVASFISAFLDSFIFSVFAWKLFLDMDISWGGLMNTYVLGSLWPRLFVALLGIPVLYFLKNWKTNRALQLAKEL